MKRSNIPEQLIEDLKKLNGLPPYDGWDNITYGDGWFYKSIEHKYTQAEIKEAYDKIIEPMRIDLEKAKLKVIKKWSKK